MIENGRVVVLNNAHSMNDRFNLFPSFVIALRPNMEQILELPRKNGKCRLNEITQPTEILQLNFPYLKTTLKCDFPDTYQT